MTATPRHDWRTVAWNGICFSAPRQWEVAELGQSYLKLALHDQAIAEFKWGQGRGRFSPRRQLKRLMRTQRGRSAASIQQIPLPPEWQKPLSDFRSQAFDWQDKNTYGRGVLLSCPICGRLSLIQFLGRNLRDRSGPTAKLLAAYRDHPKDNEQLWSVFDIHARIPQRFRLVQHRMVPGAFQLHFTASDQILALYRWSPAATILADHSLHQFAQRVFPDAVLDEWSSAAGIDRLEWEDRLARGIFDRLRWRSETVAKVRQTRLWHLRLENRIMAVRLEHQDRDGRAMFDRICGAYEIVP